MKYFPEFLFGIGILLFVCLFFVAFVYVNKDEKIFESKCLEKDGVVLINTKSTGKTVTTSRTCVDRSIIININ